MLFLDVLCLLWLLPLSNAFDNCQMNVWEGNSMTYFFQARDQTPVLTSRLDRVTFDSMSKKMAVRENWSEERKSYDRWLIYDFTNSVLFTVEGDVCHRSNLQETWEQACVTGDFNLTYSPPAWLGLLGPNIYPVFLFEHEYTVQGSVLFTATAGGFPVYTHVYGTSSGDRSILYEHIERNISDPSVLVPPPSCHARLLPLIF